MDINKVPLNKSSLGWGYFINIVWKKTLWRTIRLSQLSYQKMRIDFLIINHRPISSTKKAHRRAIKTKSSHRGFIHHWDSYSRIDQNKDKTHWLVWTADLHNKRKRKKGPNSFIYKRVCWTYEGIPSNTAGWSPLFIYKSIWKRTHWFQINSKLVWKL